MLRFYGLKMFELKVPQKNLTLALAPPFRVPHVAGTGIRDTRPTYMHKGLRVSQALMNEILRLPCSTPIFRTWALLKEGVLKSRAF